MKIRFYEGFSFSNILISLLIINLIVVICCPIHIGLLYFFKVPISNIIYHLQQCSFIELLNNPYLDLPFFISNFLVIYLIPICSILLVAENLLLKFGKISQKEKVEFSKKKTIVLFIILIIAIFAYLVSLGGWIHTMIPYLPEELEQLRYD